MTKLNADPLLIMFITLGIIIAFIGFSIAATVQHSNEMKSILKENEKAGESRTEQLQILKQLVEQQGNLTQQNREGLVKAINTTYYEVFPDINKALQNIESKLNLTNPSR